MHVPIASQSNFISISLLSLRLRIYIIYIHIYIYVHIYNVYLFNPSVLLITDSLLVSMLFLHLVPQMYTHFTNN